MPSDDQEALLEHLTFSAKAGGGFFVFMAAVVFVLLFFIDPSVGAQGTSFGLLGVAFIGLAVWLLDYKRRLRPWLVAATVRYEATLVKKEGPTEHGWWAFFNITDTTGTVRQGKEHFLGEPPWAIGETLEVCVLADDRRFFPCDLNQRADIGKMTTVT